MHNRSLFFVSFFILILSSACVTGNQHMAVKSELDAEIKQADEQIENLTAKLKSAETIGNKCLNDLKARQAQNAQLKNINLQLSKNLESLTTDLNKKKSVIKLQGKDNTCNNSRTHALFMYGIYQEIHYQGDPYINRKVINEFKV